MAPHACFPSRRTLSGITLIFLLCGFASALRADPEPVRPQVPPQGLPRLPTPLLPRPEEQAVREALSHRRPFVLLVGGLGTGKTVLAATVAYRGLYEHRYPDGVFFVRVKDRPVQQVVLDLAAAVMRKAPPPGSTQEIADRVHAILRGRSALIVLDDLRSERLPPELMRAVAQSAVIATSQRRYDDPRVSAVIPLHGLPPPQAQELLLSALPEGARDLVERGDVAALCAQLDDNPLALRLAGALMNEKGLDARALLALLSRDEGPVPAMLRLSFERMPRRQQEALVVLAQLAEAPIGQGLAQAAGGKEVADLLRWGWLLAGEGGDVEVHPLLRSFARDRGDMAAVERKGRSRMIEWLLGQSGETQPFRFHPALPEHLLMAQAWALGDGQPQQVYELALRWDGVLDHHGKWAVLAQLWGQAVGISRAAGEAGQGKLAISLYQQGLAQHKLGETAAARESYEEGLRIFDQAGNQAGMARSHFQLGLLAQDTGEPGPARRRYDEALRLFSAVRDGGGMARSHYQLGLLSQDTGDQGEARRRFHEGLRLFSLLGDQAGMACSLHQLGVVAQTGGDYPLAQRRYTDALSLLRRLDDRVGMVRALRQLGIVAETLHDYATARRRYAEGLQLFADLPDERPIHAQVLWAMARMAQKQGDPGQARSLSAQAAAINEEVYDPFPHPESDGEL